jgi:hypothetical protein
MLNYLPLHFSYLNFLIRFIICYLNLQKINLIELYPIIVLFNYLPSDYIILLLFFILFSITCSFDITIFFKLALV